MVLDLIDSRILARGIVELFQVANLPIAHSKGTCYTLKTASLCQACVNFHIQNPSNDYAKAVKYRSEKTREISRILYIIYIDVYGLPKPAKRHVYDMHMTTVVAIVK